MTPYSTSVRFTGPFSACEKILSISQSTTQSPLEGAYIGFILNISLISSSYSNASLDTVSLFPSPSTLSSFLLMGYIVGILMISSKLAAV